MQRPFETDHWPFIQAKWHTKLIKHRDVRVIVIHCMEAPEKGQTAENVGLYFKRGESRASAHVGVDSDSVVQYVRDNDIAWAAPGVNNDGIHIELAGRSSQTRQEWQDPYSTLMLDRAANVTAQYCLKYGVLPKHLTQTQLAARQMGIIGHFQATALYKPNAGHTDPGPEFPWVFFIERVGFHFNDISEKRLVQQGSNADQAALGDVTV